MKHYAHGITLFFGCWIFSTLALASNWSLVPSNDGFWMKTVNEQQHELLIAYQNEQPQFLLILKTDSPSPDKSIPVKLQIDKGLRENSSLIFLEKRSDKSIFRISIKGHAKNNYISKMIAGLNWMIYFNSGKTTENYISFSLKGFTTTFNELLIANKTGSLDPAWLIKHRKDRELYCLLTTNISINAMQYRIQGKNYVQTLALIPESGYSVIDHNLSEIINQVYSLPLESIPYEPRAEKYLIFTRCMTQAFQYVDH